MSDEILLVERNKTICKNKNIAKIMNNHFINKTSKSKSDEKNNDIMKIFLDTFTFCSVLLGDVQKFHSLSKSVLATSLKQFMDFCLLYLTNSVNYSIFRNTFLPEVNHFAIIPLYKIIDTLKKENYRPINLSPHVSEVFKRNLYKQKLFYMDEVFSDLIMVFKSYI